MSSAHVASNASLACLACPTALAGVLSAFRAEFIFHAHIPFTVERIVLTFADTAILSSWAHRVLTKYFTGTDEL
jgi:hypothetical protein